MTTTVEPKLCSRNHVVAGDNAYVTPAGRATCRECRRLRKRKSHHTARRRGRVETLTHVPNAPLRERFLEMEAAGDIDAGTIARHLGWFYGRTTRNGQPMADGTRVRRALGIVESCDGKGEGGSRYGRLRQTMLYEVAVKIAFALGMDPHEAGV